MTEPVRLTRHADVIAAAQDPERFSSRTSHHLHVPNGMDGAEHRAFRDVVERQMTPELVASLEQMLQTTAREVVAALPRNEPIDAVADLGEVFAVRAQCRWLGWPDSLESELREWMAENYAAARAGDSSRNAAVAAWFDEIVTRQVTAHREATTPGGAADDATHRLLAERVHGRPLSDDEIVSILRNWTAGDLGSLARCVGVVVHRLAERPRWQQRVRTLAQQAPHATAELDAILGECLRLDDPFVANKRVTTCPVTTPSGVTLDADSPVLLDWTAANRDADVFSPGFDPEAHAEHNLVFGAGPHVCPGRDLSYAELRAITVALLAGTDGIDFAPDRTPTRHLPPLAGWATLPVILR
ncbi:cytochrome P450 [Microbacterium sp. Re1]|uniref:Cytochrome P450 n=1 Tax=Microbacterium commune TaxID=2762219 RepID=A0ABR8W5B2_9MICO|nr:cytochrome P450 [Microbacterium commune]MBD8012199.1 cytochrome P450 [Microbacterium commune]